MSQKEMPYAVKFNSVYPHCQFHRVDRLGQPLSLERVGYANPDLVTKILTLDEITEYHLYHMENKLGLLERLGAETGHIVRTCKIMDLSGLGTKHLNTSGLGYFRELLHLSQIHYPEMLGRVYLVNSPWVFKFVWKIVKPWLNEQTLSKVVICGDDYQQVLLRNIDSKNLPKYLGGECECSGGCVELVDPENSFTKEVIKAGASRTVECKVEDKGTIVSWIFRTRKNDIQFSVIFVNKDNKSTTIAEAKRVDAASHQIEGGFEAPEPGVIHLKWDNSYSMFSSKEIIYRLDVVKKETTSTSQGTETSAS